MHNNLTLVIVIVSILLSLLSSSNSDTFGQPAEERASVNGAMLAKNDLINEEYLAFRQAIKEGRIEVVKLFLKRGASVNWQDHFMYTPLIDAAKYNHEDIVKLLIENGADVNENDGGTALMYAVSEGHLGVVQILVSNHASLDVQDLNGNTALMKSLRHHEILSYLLEKGAYINATNNKGQSALMLAAQYNLPDEVAFLLRKGAKADDSFVQTYKEYLPSGGSSGRTANVLSSNSANPILEGEWVVISATDDTNRIPDDIMKHYRYRFVKDKVILDYPLKDDYSVPKQGITQFDTPDPRKPERVVFILPDAARGNLFALAERRGDFMKLCFNRSGWLSDCKTAPEYNVKTMIRLKPDPNVDRDPLSGLIGMWSNGKNEFKTQGFGLRRDGGGHFNTAVFPVLMRWSHTDTGIVIRMGLEGKTEEMRLTYDAVRMTLTYQKPEGESEVFWRVSLKEPPDFEEQYNKAIEKEHRASERPAVSVPSKEGLADLLGRYADNDKRFEANLLLVSANKKSISLNRMPVKDGKLTSIYVSLMFAGEHPRGVTASWSDTKPSGNFELKSAIPRERIDEYLAWLQARHITYKIAYTLYKSPWKTEGFGESCNISIVNNSSAFTEAVQFLVEQTLAPFEFPVQAK